MRRDSLLLNRLLSVLLTVALVLQGLPAVPAYAEEAVRESAVVEQPEVSTDEPESTQDAVKVQEPVTVGVVAEKPVVTSEQLAPTIESPTYDPQPVAQSRSLKTSFVTADGVRYGVEARFADDARIPTNTTLRVKELRAELTSEERRNPANSDRPNESERFLKASELELHQALLETALGIVDDDYWVGQVLLDVALEADGVAIDAPAPMQLTITTDAIDPERASSARAILLSGEGLRTVQTAKERKLDAKQLAKELEAGYDYWVPTTTNAAANAAEQVVVTIAVERLGELGLAWDNGYRDTTLNMNPVTVEGVMPEGTSGTASDVADDYDDPIALAEKAGIADDVDATAACELATIAAYDITLTAEGETYEPDAEHPLTVTLTNKAIDDSKDLQLWHVLDNGTVEVIDDIVVKGHTLSFEATGFSDYVVVERTGATASADSITLTAQADDTPVTLSKTFYIRGQRGAVSNTGLVTFVDQFGTPINGTVSGTVYLNYADGTTDYPNQQDMYEFGNCLDPALEGKYEFSRVYLTLRNDAKEFRYFLVSTDYDIHGRGGTATRLYTYMTDPKVETASGGVYSGMWYTLPSRGNGAVDNTYIEFNRVAEVSFYVRTASGEPVEGAEFTLYSDTNCYREFEYKGSVARATSDSNGFVSFGKLPYNDKDNTYYMKETIVPDGYKNDGIVREVKAEDGVGNPTIIQAEDDGSVQLSNIKSMQVKGSWADGDENHADDVVTIKLYSQGEEMGSVDLTSGNAWKQTFSSLEHTIPYVVTETKVMHGDEDITDKWIPKITYEEHDPQIGYYRAEEFQQGKEYALVTTGGKALMVSGTALSTQAATIENDMLTSGVTESMLWRVEQVSNDGVITLRNVSSGRYINYVSSRWTTDASQTKFVRHTERDGNILIYYRTNMNASQATYLMVGDSIGTTTNKASATSFQLFQEIEVHAVTVSVRNHSTEYPIRIKNMQYYTDEPLPGGSYMLYTDSEFEGHLDANGQPIYADMEPVYDGPLTVDSDGYLLANGGRNFELWADTFYLVQKSTTEDYLPSSPAWLKFTVTRTGAVRVERTKEQFPDYTYVSTDEEGGTTYPLLRVPNQRPATVSLHKVLEDDSLDAAAVSALRFAFEAELHDATGRAIEGWTFADGATTNAEGKAELSLSADEVKALSVPVGDTLTLTELSQGYAVKVAQGEGDQVRARSFTYVVPGESTVTFTNIKPICKIEDDGVEQPFESLTAAVAYARENMAGERATIEMLVDYEQPAPDAVSFEQGDNIVLTTAAKQGTGSTKQYYYTGSGSVATITRAHAGESMLSGSGLLRLTNITLDGNNDAYSNLALNGGIVNWTDGSLELGEGATLRKSAVVAGGVGQGSGGAVYLGGAATLTMTGASITDCSAARGGGVYSASTGAVSLADSAVSSCSADEGGALWMGTGAQLILAKTVALSNNVALNGGGALYVQGADVSVANTISHNRAGEGGALYCKGATVQLLEGAQLEANGAVTNGGGAYMAEGAILTMGAGLAVTANEAVNGGGIYVATGGTAVLASGDPVQAVGVQGNSASGNGAGIYLCSAGKLKLEGLVTIDENTDGTGDLYLAAEATGAEIEVTGDLAEGSRIAVWAEDAERDGKQVTVDEPFGITTAADAATVTGLDSFVSQRAAEEEGKQTTAIAGVGNVVLWGNRATVEVRLEATGSYADQTEKFDFTLTLPEGEPEVKATVAGEEVTFTSDNNSFQLAHGEVLVLKDIQAYLPHVITQTSSDVVNGTQASGGKYTTTVRLDEAPEGSTSAITLQPSSDTRIASFTEVVGTADDPARLVITNTLADDAVPQTGLDDNALVWLGIMGGALLGIVLLFALRRRRASRV